jgi:hypothetical protein
MTDVRGTRLLRGRIQAEVMVGTADTGGLVTVVVEVNTTDPEIREALDQLHQILRRRAFDRVDSAVKERKRWIKAEKAVG